MRHVVADIETDGLLDELTQVHSLVLRDVETDAVVSCTDSAPPEWYREAPNRFPLSYGYALLKQAERVYWHNGIRFDFPALRKVNGEDPHPADRVRDTFVIAAMRWAHIREQDYRNAEKGKFPKNLAGSHSLEAWGYRLGEFKGEYTDWCKERGIENPWAHWCPEMQAYCEQDTSVGRALVLLIRKAGVSAESVEIEHELAWYLAQQERNGWPFDMDKAIALQAKLAARREALGDQLRRIFGMWVVPAGVHTIKRTTKTDKGKPCLKLAGAQYTKLKVIEFNPGSRDHIADRLIKLYGWKPESFTKSGKPKVDDDTLSGLNTDVPEVKAVVEYLTVAKRLGQISEGKEAWLRQVRVSPTTGLPHIYGRVKQNHAVTHRAAHANPNVAQVPKVGSPYGAECRELFHVPEGWAQIGADASGLEARCLGHYMAKYDGGAYAKLLLEGDVHTENRIALGLPEGKEFRDRAKTWYYAFIFGSGDEKSGRILAPEKSPAEHKKIGAAKKKLFLKNTPALGLLIDAVKAQGKENANGKGLGFLKMPDGRRTYIRSEHAALNSLIQSSGAIICKRWIVDFNRRLTAEFGPQGWDGRWVALGWIHDEVQLAVRPEIAERVCEILVESIRGVTEKFHWRVPLDGEAKIGKNWRDCH